MLLATLLPRLHYFDFNLGHINFNVSVSNTGYLMFHKDNVLVIHTYIECSIYIYIYNYYIYIEYIHFSELTNEIMIIIVFTILLTIPKSIFIDSLMKFSTESS